MLLVCMTVDGNYLLSVAVYLVGFILSEARYVRPDVIFIIISFALLGVINQPVVIATLAILSNTPYGVVR